MIATGAIIPTAGVRNGRLRPGSVRRSTSTEIATIMKANKRARVRIVGELADGQESRGKHHADTGDSGHDVRRAETRMHRGELVRKQAVAGHDEEDPGLAEHHHQHDRRERDERRDAHEVADPLIADRAQNMGQRLARADQRLRHAAATMALHWLVSSMLPGGKGWPSASRTGCAPMAPIAPAATSR